VTLHVILWTKFSNVHIHRLACYISTSSPFLEEYVLMWNQCIKALSKEMSIHPKSMEPVYQFYSRRLERPKKLKSCIVMDGNNTKAEPSRLLLLNSFFRLSSVLQQNLLSPFCGGSQVYQTFFLQEWSVGCIDWMQTSLLRGMMH